MEITRDVTLDTSAEEAWRLLTDEAELSAWLADEVTLDARPGGTGRLVDGDEVRAAIVDEIEDGKALRLLWWTVGDAGGPVSEVTFTLAPAEQGTRVHVVERVRGGVGPKGRALAAAAWDDRLLGLELRCLAGARLAVG
ncbi:MAG: SRPBCC family protein [Acidimicrobiales bacterium]